MNLCWPVPQKDLSSLRRVDQGQDMQFPVGTNILAVADGTISYAHDPHGFGDPYPVLHLDTPIDGNPAVYYGHQHPDVVSGVHVQQGRVVAQAAQKPGGNAVGLPGWLEIGWWNNGPTGDGQSMHDHLLAAPEFGGEHPMPLNKPAVALLPVSAQGYYIVAEDGGLFAYGDATPHGDWSLANLPHRGIVDAKLTPTGNGLWYLASDGAIYAFGDAQYKGGANT